MKAMRAMVSITPDTQPIIVLNWMRPKKETKKRLDRPTFREYKMFVCLYVCECIPLLPINSILCHESVCLFIYTSRYKERYVREIAEFLTALLYISMVRLFAW